MTRAAIVKRDRWMPWHYRGQTLYYVIVWYGDPYIRLFQRPGEQHWFLRRCRNHGTPVLGRGKVRYYPLAQPQARHDRADEALI
jgi:hypothetical protein